MDWQTKKIDEAKFSDAYKAKYGLASDYQKAQRLLYAEPEIAKSFKEAASWLRLDQGSSVLDIGVNNGYELELLNDLLGGEFLDKAHIVGFDLVDDVLADACERLRCGARKNLRFVTGDIRNFEGMDVLTGERVILGNESFDLVIAITSLQSSSLAHDFDSFLGTLLSKLKSGGQVLVATPNMYVDQNGHYIKGLFDAKKQVVDTASAVLFSDRLKKLMERQGFKVRQVGENSIIQYFYT